MQINILVVGEKSLSWIEAGVNQYIARMPRECKVQVTTVATAKRTKNHTIKQAQLHEQELLAKHTSSNSLRIALDEHGKPWTSTILAEKLEH